MGLAVLLTVQSYSPAAIFMIDLDDRQISIPGDNIDPALFTSGRSRFLGFKRLFEAAKAAWGYCVRF
jgi:hypothetical protein